MLIIKVAKREGKCNWLIKIIINEMQRVMEDYHDIHVVHIYCEGKNMANNLAKAIQSVMQLAKWDDISLLPFDLNIEYLEKIMI